MKISLFYKSYITKACSFILAISLMAGTPLMADANGLTDLVKTVFGGEEAQADESASSTNSAVRNSQTLSLLLESSVNPDLNHTNDPEDIVIVQDDSFIYSDGSYIPDVKFEKSSISDKINVYTVEKGDTLSEIAEAFDVSMNTIRWENNISGNNISVGQKLNILPVTGVKHIVKSGDTISKIADKYEAEAEDILVFNDISKGDAIKQGDIVFVPNGIIKAVVAKPSTSSTSGKTVASNTKAPSGYYLRPVAGIITSPYGSRKGGFHYGIDIGNKRGTPVLASAPGTVIKVISSCKEGQKNCGGRYGNYIVIQHPNGTRTFYAHLSKTSVYIGQTVAQGDTIGAVGSTGRSTGPHLHFEIENSNGSKMKPVF